MKSLFSILARLGIAAVAFYFCYAVVSYVDRWPTTEKLADGSAKHSQYCYGWQSAFPPNASGHTYLIKPGGARMKLMEEQTFDANNILRERKITTLRGDGLVVVLEHTQYDASGKLHKSVQRYVDRGDLKQVVTRLSDGTLESTGYFVDGLTLEDHRIVKEDGTVLSAEVYSLGVLEKTIKTFPDGRVDTAYYSSKTVEQIKEVVKTLPDGRRVKTAVRVRGDRPERVESVHPNGQKTTVNFDKDGNELKN